MLNVKILHARHSGFAVATVRGVCAIVLGLACTTVAVAAEEECWTNKPRAIFVNGVWNDDQWKTWLGATELNVAATQAGLSDLAFETFFNPGDGVLNDAFEAAIYRTDQSFDDRLIVGDVMAQIIVYERQQALARGRVQIERLKAAIKETLAARRAVVIVAHSQGNLYTNQAIRELAGMGVDVSKVGVLGVATPDGEGLERNYRYVTSSRDPIIRLVPGALPANFQVITETPLELLKRIGHSFIETYLSDQLRSVDGFIMRQFMMDALKDVRDRTLACKTPGISFRLEFVDLREVFQGSYAQCIERAQSARNAEGNFQLFQWLECMHYRVLVMYATDSRCASSSTPCGSFVIGRDVTCSYSWSPPSAAAYTPLLGSPVYVYAPGFELPWQLHSTSGRPYHGGSGTPPPGYYDMMPQLTGASCHGSIVDRETGQAVYTF